MSDNLPPDWAIERAFDLCPSTAVPFGRVAVTKERPELFGATLAFARYIAAHEDPPVDPLRQEAIAIVLAEAVARTDNQIAAIKSGQAGEGKVELVLAALRRGIELAKAGPA